MGQEVERLIVSKQIEIIEKVLAKKAYPKARAISVKKLEAELAELETKLAVHNETADIVG